MSTPTPTPETPQAVATRPAQAITAPAPTVLPEFNAFSNIANFEQAQRMAKALCTSSIVPETYRGEANLGNCVIAIEIANRVGASVLAVMQNLYIVYGRPAWSSQFLISCVNASRKFSPMRYKITGEPGTDTWGCIAWAQDETGERLESPEVTIAMAKAEGWFTKNGSKWKTMPALMLRYRAATLFARLYAPELTMGIRTDDEVIDIETVSVSPVVTEQRKPEFGPEPVRLLASAPKPVNGTGKAPATESPSEPQKPQDANPGTGGEPAKDGFKPREGSSEGVNNILYLAHRDGLTEEQAFELLKTVAGMVRGETKLDEFDANGRGRKLVDFAKIWDPTLKKSREAAAGSMQNPSA